MPLDGESVPPGVARDIGQLTVLRPRLGCNGRGRGTTDLMNTTVLWIIAALLVIVGVVQILQGQIILGIVLIVLGLLVGPGGYSIFNRR